jgi:hypothetical protein
MMSTGIVTRTSIVNRLVSVGAEAISAARSLRRGSVRHQLQLRQRHEAPGIASISGLGPSWGSIVWVGPPLFASAPSSGLFVAPT